MPCQALNLLLRLLDQAGALLRLRGLLLLPARLDDIDDFPDRTYYLDESFVVTERKRKYDGLLPVTELDKLSKQARYKLAHAAEIRARDKERKAAARMAAKKAFKAQKLTEVTNG